MVTFDLRSALAPHPLVEYLADLRLLRRGQGQRVA